MEFLSFVYGAMLTAFATGLLLWRETTEKRELWRELQRTVDLLHGRAPREQHTVVTHTNGELDDERLRREVSDLFEVTP